MPRKFIFGSGIVGLLARTLLGSEWEIIPFNRSRFFSFAPALDDNFIIRDERIDHFIEHIGGKIAYIYQSKYSLGGELFSFTHDLCNSWLANVFGIESPSRALSYLQSRQAFTVYDIKLNRLYEQLQNQIGADLKLNAEKGRITEVGDHYFVRNGNKIGFDQVISTIPLNALLQLMGSKQRYQPKQIWYYHIETKDLDFEGVNQVLIVDGFEFFKCANIAKNRYMFYCTREIDVPGPYFMQFMRTFDLIDGTTIPEAMPCGDRPKLDHLESKGFFCVGGFAENDWCACVGSNIMRMLKFKEYLNGGPKPDGEL